MEFCRHKQTGKYFVYIHDSGNNEALLVTPLAEIKALNLDQFDEVEEQDDDYLLRNHYIEAEQAERYREYQKSRSEEAVENMRSLYEEMLPYHQKEFLEWIKKEYGS